MSWGYRLRRRRWRMQKSRGCVMSLRGRTTEFRDYVLAKRWGGWEGGDDTFLRIEIGRGRRVLSLRRVGVCNDLPFCVPDIGRRSLWGEVPLNPFCKVRFVKVQL